MVAHDEQEIRITENPVVECGEAGFDSGVSLHEALMRRVVGDGGGVLNGNLPSKFPLERSEFIDVAAESAILPRQQPRLGPLHDDNVIRHGVYGTLPRRGRLIESGSGVLPGETWLRPMGDSDEAASLNGALPREMPLTRRADQEATINRWRRPRGEKPPKSLSPGQRHRVDSPSFYPDLSRESNV